MKIRNSCHQIAKFAFIRALAEGKSMNEVTYQFNNNKSTVCRISLRYHEANNVEINPVSD